MAEFTPPATFRMDEPDEKAVSEYLSHICVELFRNEQDLTQVYETYVRWREYCGNNQDAMEAVDKGTLAVTFMPLGYVLAQLNLPDPEQELDELEQHVVLSGLLHRLAEYTDVPRGGDLREAAVPAHLMAAVRLLVDLRWRNAVKRLAPIAFNLAIGIPGSPNRLAVDIVETIFFSARALDQGRWLRRIRFEAEGDAEPATLQETLKTFLRTSIRSYPTIVAFAPLLSMIIRVEIAYQDDWSTFQSVLDELGSIEAADWMRIMGLFGVIQWALHTNQPRDREMTILTRHEQTEATRDAWRKIPLDLLARIPKLCLQHEDVDTEVRVYCLWLSRLALTQLGDNVLEAQEKEVLRGLIESYGDGDIVKEELLNAPWLSAASS